MRTTPSLPEQSSPATRNVLVLYGGATMMTLGEQCRFWSCTLLDDPIFSLNIGDVCLIHIPAELYGPPSSRVFSSLCQQHSSRVMVVVRTQLSPHVLPESLDLLVILAAEESKAESADRYGAAKYPVWIVKHSTRAEDRSGAFEWVLKALERSDDSPAELRHHCWVIGRGTGPEAAVATSSGVTPSAAAAAAVATPPAVLSDVLASPFMGVGKSEFRITSNQHFYYFSR